MIRALILALALIPAVGLAQQVTSAPGGSVRVLDKIAGTTTDLTLADGQSQTIGRLTIQMRDCRYPTDNPTGNAYGDLVITYQGNPVPVFEGWMIATAPALNAMDHPRYDVWMLRCTTS